MSTTVAMADEGGYTMGHALVKAVIHKDNTWDISEYLYVNFNESRHGIYRYIPTAFSYHFPGPNGTDVEYKYRTVVDSVDVLSFPFEEDDDNTPAFNKIIKIGDPERKVTGLQKYFIHYRLRYLDDRYKGEDFLCHTIWGTGWNTPVDTLHALLQFEDGIPEGLIENLHVYSGALGSKTNADSVVVDFNQEKQELYIVAHNLPAQHAVTLSAKLPEGYWEIPAKDTTSFYGLLAAAGAMAVVLIVTFLRNTNNRPTRIVSFHPPAGMTSAEVGKVIDDSVDDCDLASLIPFMAHHKYINIKEVPAAGFGEPTLELSLNVPLTPNEPLYMRQFLEALFDGKETVRLDQLENRGKALAKVAGSIDSIYEGKNALTSTSTLAVWLWRIMVLVLAIAVGRASLTGAFDPKFFFYTLLTSGAGMYYLGHRRRGNASDTWSWTASRKVMDFMKWTAIGALVIAVNINMINEGLLAVDSMHVALPLAAAGIITYFTSMCVTSTRYRNNLMGELMGLHDFIETAEQDRLRMLVDEDPQYFYEVLPYAIAFGLSDKWVSQFSNIVTERPEWYSTVSGNITDYMVTPRMISSLTDITRKSIKSSVAQATASSSSGSWIGGLFSGGGSSYSGGGGGGGGGGSW